jgi:prephenate dehydratase
MVVAYLGPKGSYSYLAGEYMRPNAELKACAGFSSVFCALASGEVDGAVVPIENSLNGGIAQVMDLMLSSQGIVAVEEYKLKIEHRLITLKGADLSGITRIYSHVQALEQCSKYLSENFPSAKLIETPSTTAGLEMVKSKTDACIAGAHILREGFETIGGNIADESKNCTHFLYIVKGEIPSDKVSSRIFFSFNCPNVAGALVNILNIVCLSGVNMTKIESRPVKDREEEYSFFVEIEGNYSSKKIRDMLKRVEEASASFKLLGCY